MTTKPKAKKFRIRRGGAATDSAEAASLQRSEPRATEAAPTASAAPAAPSAPRPENVLRSSSAQPAQAAQTGQPAQRPVRPVQPRQPAPQAAAQPAQSARDYVADVKANAAANAPAPHADEAAQRAQNLAAIAAKRQAHAQMQAQAQAQAHAQAHAQAQAAQSGMVSSAAETAADQEIDAIRREGLTGRQLRMARRVAQKHGLAPTSDFDAVRLLRASGIEPFKKTNPLELVVPGASNAMPVQGEDAQLPQTVTPQASNLPSPDLAPAERRTQEIMEIQKDIARRRRRKMILLMTRLGFFVFLPTLLVAWYFTFIASPLYATKSEFLVLQADATGGSGLGGLLSGTQFATNQDAIAVQKFLTSRDAMLRLDGDLGFKDHFSQETIDPIKRLPVEATQEDAYKLYKRYVKIGYDPTEGVIHMEVIAADPQISATFSEHLIGYAEEQVDELSRRKREDQMREASASLDQAKLERREAQQRLVALQEGTLLDPEGEMALIRSLINNVEVQLQEKELALKTQLNNPRPNRPKVAALQSEVDVLEEELRELQARLNEAQNGETSLAAKAAEIQMAQADVATADVFLQSALQNEKQTALEANRQVRYLTTAVTPVAPDAATYPRAFENTILAFLVLAGAYLMISLTASILREQVSS